MSLEEQALTDDFQNEVQRLSQVEARAFEEFRQTFMFMRPYPIKGRAEMDWEFWTALSTSISGVALAAFRTGQAFYLAAAAHSSALFSVIESVVAVVAIEGSLVLFALQDARAKRKSMDRNARVLGLAITLIISALAGLYQSSGILADGGQTNQFVTILNWLLVLLMGVGATAIAFLGGDILGVQIVRYELMRAEIEERFQQDERAYEAELLQAWVTSKENQALQSRKRTNYRNERIDERTPRVRSSQRTNERTPRTNGSSNGSRDEIFELMDKYFIESNGQVPGQSQVCRLLARQRDGSEAGFERFKGYVHKVYHLWTPPQQYELPIPQEGA